MTRIILAVSVFLWVLTGVSAQPADYNWTFNNDGSVDYRLTVVSSTDLFAGALPSDDPTINLQVGKRYQVTVVNFGPHPLEIIAKGASSGNDTALLAQGATNGSFEANAEVAWVDGSGGVVTFTMTADLLAAMQNGGRIPGYRCLAHPASMRGNFNVTAAQVTPTPTETQPPTATPTNTTEPTATPTETVEPSTTPTDTLEPSATPTATLEMTSTSTETSEPTATDTATEEPTPTDTVEATATPSETTVLPTATPTNTPRSADLTGDGLVDSRDLLELMRQWHLQLK